MSVVVALKYNDGIVVGGDKRITTGWHTSEDNACNKIFKTKYSNHCIGSVGSGRDCDIIGIVDELMYYKDILKNVKVDLEYVVDNVVEKLFDKLRDKKRVRVKDGIESINSNHMYVTNEKIFSIAGSGAVLEHSEYGVIGCGSEMVMGYLDTLDLSNLSKNKAIEYIEIAIQQACKHSSGIDDNVDIIVIDGK